jgi:GT2 family glycosyltransferase
MRCDIIIPIWNQFDYTKACIESIFSRTKFPFHLILVDNASLQPTRRYLERLVQDKKDTVTLLRNEKNLGFVQAVNQGMRNSSAPYVCLLNNDTVVAADWLMEMVKVAQSRQDIGIVNPNSNTLGYKLLGKARALEAVAEELKSFSGAYSELAWANGFCMLIKRKLIQQLGLFDEIYGMGTFEDADFSKRAQRLSYLCVCARAAFVYHRERRSFIKYRKFDQDFNRNRQIFFAKWGKTERLLYILTKDSPEVTEKIVLDALSLARQGSTIWFFLKDQHGRTANLHSNICIYYLPKHFFKLASFWRILKRKKKFDKIYVDDQGYAEGLKNLKLLHQAEIIYT